MPGARVSISVAAAISKKRISGPGLSGDAKSVTVFEVGSIRNYTLVDRADTKSLNDFSHTNIDFLFFKSELERLRYKNCIFIYG